MQLASCNIFRNENCTFTSTRKLSPSLTCENVSCMWQVHLIYSFHSLCGYREHSFMDLTVTPPTVPSLIYMYQQRVYYVIWKPIERKHMNLFLFFEFKLSIQYIVVHNYKPTYMSEHENCPPPPLPLCHAVFSKSEHNSGALHILSNLDKDAEIPPS